jgi:histidinol-phosphate aminotransferase
VRILDYYRQFKGLSAEEVNSALRESAANRRRQALARVDPLDLSRTTWPDYAPSTVVNAITYAARRGLHRELDRDASELRSELAHRHGIGERDVVVGDGITQLLDAAIHELLEPGDELVTPWPSYPLYPAVARRAHCRAVPVAGGGVESILEAVTDRTRVVCLCNPNDPTGELMPSGELGRLLDELPERVVVLLDEALRDFVDAEPVDAALGLLAEHPRLIVFRTFSKAWGLAGLRCGYAIGGDESSSLLDRLAPYRGVNELARAGALEALRGAGHIARARAQAVAAQRARLAVELRSRPFTIAPSQANVLWLAAGGLAGAELAHRLQRAGIIVAGGGPLGDPARVRVTIPHRPEGTGRLLRALDAVL